MTATNHNLSSNIKDVEPKSYPEAQPSPLMDEQTGQIDDHKRFPLWQKLVSVLGIEVQGNEPIPAHEQNERRHIKLFTLWFSMNFNLIAISTGMTGTLSYGMSLRDCSLVILFFGLLTSLCAPYLSIWGSKFGLRQMIHARYSFGKYGAAVPLLFNMATLAGYAIIDCILGGQAISAVSRSGVSVNVGIVVIAIITLVITFCGAKWIHYFDQYAWLPSLVGVIGALGGGGRYLHLQVDTLPVTPRTVLSYGSLVAGFFLPWAAIASDFTTYFDRRPKGLAIFAPSYIGLILSGIPLFVLGAAIGGAVPNVPSWQEGYNENSVGGVMGAMLEPVGGFGKFLLVLLALSVLGNIVGTVYALTLNFGTLLGLVRVRLPRFVYSFAVTAIIIPIAIKAAADFLSSLNNFLGIISYWPACFVAVVTMEHLIFRKGTTEDYDLAQWDAARGLPSGIAALAASVLSFGLVIPGMDQLWYVGPIAETTGDIGFEMAFAVTGLLYFPFRYIETRFLGWK